MYMCITVNKTGKWLAGGFLSFVIAMMGLQVNVMMTMNNNLLTFMKDNAAQHREIETSVINNHDWTHSVYKYEIQPNTEFREKYSSNKKK